MNQPFPPNNNPYAAQTQAPSGMHPQAPQSSGDGTGGLIPYKNPQALIAYYLGLFSLFPLLGLFLAIPAFILGILGLRARARNPAVKGSVHAWIGIVFGFTMTLLWGLMWVGMIIAMIGSASR
ncbi:MAG: hypothetical protein U0892_05775 [Pirellulales bacterium]